MIRKLQVLATSVRAEVVIGENDFGGAVSTTVQLPRRSEEVQDAMATLENLLLRTAQEHVKVSADRRHIEAQVRERIDKRLNSERERIRKNALAENERRIRELERERDEQVRQKNSALQAKERMARDFEQERQRLSAAVRTQLQPQDEQGEQVNRP